MLKSKASLFTGTMALLLGHGHSATVIQAESYTAKDAGTVLKTAGAITYMDFASAANAYLEWNNITVADAGEYKIVLHYASGNPTVEGVKVKLLVNDGSQVNASSTALQTLPNTGDWTLFKDANYIVRLNSGTNKIRITQSTVGGPNIDYMTLYATKTKMYTGVLNGNGDAIPGLAAGPHGDQGIPETLRPDQVRGTSCYISAPDFARVCIEDPDHYLVHGYDAPTNTDLWYLHQWDSNGGTYTLEVRYWE